MRRQTRASKHNEVKPKVRRTCSPKEKNDTSEEPTYIFMLNDYCLQHIFLYLPLRQRLKVELVCTRWRDLFQYSWSDIKKLDFSRDFPLNIIKDFHKQAGVEQLLNRCGKYLTELSLSPICCSTIMPIVREQCVNLKTLRLTLNDYSDRYFSDAFLNMKNLNFIEIGRTRGTPIRCLQSLREEVELIFISNPDCPSNPRLKHNSLAKFNNLQYLSIYFYSLDKNEIKIISQKQTLVFLDLKFCKLNAKDIHLLSNLVNLVHIDLQGTDRLPDSLLIHISMRCKSLKWMDLSFTRVTDVGVFYLIERLENLEYLDVGRTFVTKDTLIFASEVTKTRQNNTILYLVLDAWKLDRSDSVIYTSPFLSLIMRTA